MWWTTKRARLQRIEESVRWNRYLLVEMLEKIDARFKTLGEKIMALADDIRAVKAQLDKAKQEIVDKISALEATIAAGGDVTAAMNELKGSAQALDDVVPDAPV